MKREEKEKLFAKYYVALKFNGSAAYIKVSPKTSPKVARSEASKMMAKPSVQKLVQEATKKVAKRALKTADDVVRELELLAFSNPINIVEKLEKGTKLTDAESRAVAGKGYSKSGQANYKIAEKKGALETLAKIHGLCTERVINETENTFNKRMEKITERFKHDPELAAKIDDEIVDE